ncbi:unnamed protein product [Moneuplotes crassus]|uniref:Protein kinase domain-containing protein n=1 Tax=Euplotes crassus TaxID=5936 RepID=A0AAD1X5F7_EUPCR|nr:unnamed protein product [Moneuplotes crassus]
MDQFLDPNSSDSDPEESKDQAMDDERGFSSMKNIKKPISDPLAESILNTVEKRASEKILPPQLNRGYSFCQQDSEIGYSAPSVKNIFHQGVNCKKNLFGDEEEDENKDPNFDISMSSSPEKGFKTPIDGLLDDLSRKSKSKFCFYYIFSYLGHQEAPELQTEVEQRRHHLQGKILFRCHSKICAACFKNKKRGNKRKRSDLDEIDQSISSAEKEDNPFLNITPQMKRKVRKCSFQAEEKDAQLEYASPPRDKKVICETPTPAKTLWKYPNILDDGTPIKNYEDVMELAKHSSDRGNRFHNDFEEISIIGKGHFGSVIKARNKCDGIEYAIKITEKQNPKNRMRLGEALQEAYALAALSVSSENPYIVRYNTAWHENEQLYIQMELCEKSLFDRFEEVGTNLSEKEIKEILKDICFGLKELHSKGIVHLDVKLENILLGNCGKYKLGDLGMSRVIDKIKADVPEGDSRYLAHELLNNDPNAPLPDLKKCDVFALGILSYELMQGVRCQKNGTEWQNLREDNIHFSKEDNYSSEIKEMVTTMLSSDPKKRLSIEEILEKYLDEDKKRSVTLEHICKKLFLKCKQLNEENTRNLQEKQTAVNDKDLAMKQKEELLRQNEELRKIVAQLRNGE